MNNTRFRIRTFVAIVAMGVLALGTVSTARAFDSVESISVGDRFKVSGEGSAVYYMADDGYQVFSHAWVYHTYFDAFTDIKVLPQGSLAQLTPSAMKWVSPRSGSTLLKAQGDAAVYVVVDGKKHHLMNPVAAKRLFGETWEHRIRLVSSDYLSTFSESSDLDDVASLVKGQIVKTSDGSLYFYNGTQLVKAYGLTKGLANQAVMISDEMFAAQKMSGDPLGLDARGVVRKDIEFHGLLEEIKEDMKKEMKENVKQEVKKETKEDVKKEEKKQESKTEETSDEKQDDSKKVSQSVHGLVFHNANYTGPFPAPEGMVLTGTVGDDTFTNPTGSGPYKFKIQTDWKRPVACLDSSRVRIGSKGITWENGWMAGYKAGQVQFHAVLPVYNAKPTGSGAGTALYDEGYKIGYDAGWEDRSSVSTEYVCPLRLELSKEEIIAQYDADGWEIDSTVDGAPGLTMYYPQGSSILNARTNQQVPGHTIRVQGNDETEGPHTAELNKSLKAVNVDYIDFGVDIAGAEELALGVKGVLQAVYDDIKKKDATALCATSDPSIATNTFGTNVVTTLDFFSACDVDGSSKVDIAWIPRHYAIMEGANNKWLTMFFSNNNDIGNSDNTEVDMNKYVNADFVTQFLTKIKFQ